MNKFVSNAREQQAAIAFSRQSVIFDELYAADTTVHYKRKRVRDVLRRYLQAGSHILELNAGTGEDAVFLAKQGHRVHATDIAPGMQQKLAEKVTALELGHMVTHELCSFTALETLQEQGPFDCIFSNFAGLNCSGELEKVLGSFEKLLRPGGLVVLVVLPKFCLWETALLLRGKFRTATRRFFSRHGRKATIDGAAFTCWYYTAGYTRRIMNNGYEHLQTEGLCSIVPPSYIAHFAERRPALFAWLCKTEDRLKGKWPWNSIGDYYIIGFRKK